jgi:hypothetical protein
MKWKKTIQFKSKGVFPMEKHTAPGTKVIAIPALLLLFLFQGLNASAKKPILADDACTQSKVAFDTSSLRYVFSHTEEILSNPEAFWENDSAYSVIKKILTGLKRPIPLDKWKKNISAIAELSKEERQKNRYYLLARELEEKAAYFNSTAIPYVCSYFPMASELDISFTAYFSAYTGAYRIMYQNDLIIDVAHSNWGGSSGKILNNLVRVLFDVGYRKICNLWTEEPSDNKIYRLLENIYLRGMATYVGYKALHLFAAPDVLEYTMLENPSDVARLRWNLNNVLSNAEKMSKEDLQRSAREVGIRHRAYSVVGASVAKTIEDKLGRNGLTDALGKGPRSFVQTYNSLVKDDEKIYVFDMESN